MHKVPSSFKSHDITFLLYLTTYSQLLAIIDISSVYNEIT